MFGKNFTKQTKESSEVTVLQNMALFDGVSDKIKKDLIVIVEDGIIADIGEKDEVSIPQYANILDLSEKTVIPGLIDSHLHLLQSGVDDFRKPY